MKLLELRRYCTDMASDMADGKAARMITRHVNAALEQVASSHEWSFLRDRAQVALEAPATGVALGVVQGSDLFTLTGEVWLQTWIDEKREVLVDGEEGILFRFDALQSAAVARMTQEWIAATDATTSYTVLRGTYPLPANTSVVTEVRLADSRQILVPLSPEEFDFRKQESVTLQADPIYYTVRGDELEVWPTPEEAKVLLLSRKRVPALVVDASPDTTLIDWPDRFGSLLYRALDVQIVTNHSKSTSLEPSLALAAFQAALARAKETDGGRQPGPRHFTLGGSMSWSDRDRLAAKRGRVES